MSWVRLDDQFPDHPKVLGLSDQAFRLHVTALCYCSAQLTDGRVTALLTRRLTWFVTDSNAVTNELVTTGLWERDGEDFIIHDYLEYNPSAEQVKSARKANADRQKRHRNVSNGNRNALRNALVTAPPTPSPSSSSETGTGKPTLADVLRLFTERFYETFGHQPPIQTAGDDGALAKLIAAGLTLQQIDHAIASSLDSFSPTSANPFPKTWRYCLPAMQRAMDPAKSKPSNGTDPTIRKSNVPGLSPEELAAADARQAAYEQQMAAELERAGLLR